MELADVTDSKSVGSNTVRVRPPPSAPSNKPTLFMRGLIAFVPTAGGRTRNLRVVQGCTIAVAQSRRKDAPTQTTAIRHPARHISVITNRHSPAFLVPGGRTRNLRVVQGCTIVLAPSFARCETNRASIKRKDAR